MANILFVNVPYAGHTNPTLPLVRALVNRGHHVSYVNAEKFREKIEKTGAEFIPFENYPANPSEQQKKMRCFRAAFDTSMKVGTNYDLLIYEMFFYPGIKVAENLGIPCVRQFSQPAWNRDTIAEAAKLFKLSCKLIDWQVMGRRNWEYMKLKNKTLMESVVYDRPDLNLVYVPQIFQPHRKSFGNDYLFTVPQAEETVSDTKIPYKKMKPPIVYISLGSIISNRGFCKKCIRAFGKTDMSVILNTGKIKPELLGRIPSNIYAYPFVPQIEVLEHADIFVTHCGMNSVNEAMAAGVPMVAMPFINDQTANGKEIVKLGIGKRIRAFLSSDRDLYQAVCMVLRDKQIRSRSREIQILLKKERSLDEIVRRVETLINRREFS